MDIGLTKLACNCSSEPLTDLTILQRHAPTETVRQGTVIGSRSRPYAYDTDQLSDYLLAKAFCVIC